MWRLVRSALLLAAMLGTLSAGCYESHQVFADGHMPDDPGPFDDAHDESAVEDGRTDDGEMDDGEPDDGDAPDRCDAACDDGIPCTVDSCDPAIGCVFRPDSSRCDDGVDCTSDSCVPGVGCTFVPDDDVCDDGVACTGDRCDPTGGCVHHVNDAACSDGINCTIDQCDPEAGCRVRPDDSLCDAAEHCDILCHGCVLDIAPAGSFLAASGAVLYRVNPVVPSATVVGPIGVMIPQFPPDNSASPGAGASCCPGPAS